MYVVYTYVVEGCEGGDVDVGGEGGRVCGDGRHEDASAGDAISEGLRLSLGLILVCPKVS